MAISTIQYNGEKYLLNVSIFSPTKNKPFADLVSDDKKTLQTDNIRSIEIVHDIINPLLTGTIKYVDNEYSIIKGFQQKPYVYVIVQFGKQSPNSDADYVSFDTEFTHLFLVNNIKIIGQNKSDVTYQIDLISATWWKFTQSLSYNTGNIPKPVTSILADCFNASGLQLNTNNLSTKSERIYISSANDTLKTAYDYLLSKTYIPAAREGGVSFIIYDHLKDEYNLWRLAANEPHALYRNNLSSYIDSIYIAIQTSGINELTQAEPNALSVVNFQNRTEMIEALFDYHEWVYDYTTNQFSDRTANTQSIIDNLMTGWDTYNSRYYDFANTATRAIPFQSLSNEQFKREESRWSNTISQYKNLIGNMINNNVAIVNTAGDLRRKPGSAVILEIDDADDNPLLDLQGSWINLRTRHIITSQSYKNNVMLGRIHQ